jgi:glycine/D-amino acid oxidase-like deaminating enzyme
MSAAADGTQRRGLGKDSKLGVPKALQLSAPSSSGPSPRAHTLLGTLGHRREQAWRMRPWTLHGRSGRASLWVDQALADEPGAESDAQPLEGLVRTDVCIVGGGFTGLWTAIRLLDHDPSLGVVVVEAELSGTGASGRNGGVMSDWWMEIDTLLKHFGRDEGPRIAAYVANAADDIDAFCKQEGIHANVAREGWLWTATSDAQVASLQHMLEATRAVGADVYAPVGADELEARLGSPMHRMGLFDANGGSVHPARLTRGLRAAAIRRGATVFEYSPVLAVEAGRDIRVRCERGVVEAQHVVMAANAWMAHLPEFRRDTFICSSDLIATAPAPDRFEQMGWTGKEVSFDAKAMLYYWRSTADQRVVFGNVGRTLALGPTIRDHFERPPEDLRSEIEVRLRLTLPRLGSVRVTHAWAGPIDRSSTGLPRVGSLGGDARITYVIGFSGTGVLPTASLGRCLASRILDRDDEATDISRLLEHRGSPFPPEPFRYLGGKLVQRAIQKKETAEDLGLKPPRITTALTAAFLPDGTHLAPPTLSSLRRALTHTRRHTS